MGWIFVNFSFGTTSSKKVISLPEAQVSDGSQAFDEGQG
jgi:hypothetical protein